VSQRARAVRVLGTRGIPNRHGGFESCVEHLAPWLVERGWDVTVYCQEAWGQPRRRSTWRGVTLEHVPVRLGGSAGSVLFDVACARDAARYDDVLLTMGFNTAVVFPWYQVRRRRHVVNMDGLEWRRGKWPAAVRAWFYGNSWIAGVSACRLIADHPEIASLLARRGFAARTAMVPYGAERLDAVPAGPLAGLDLESQGYVLVIARPEPENSILEIVRAWGQRPRTVPLVVLGQYDDSDPYHRAVRAAATAGVRFVGPIYEAETVQALRAHARLYVHGHTVGGTNPSLVEALGAGSPVLAHDNRFNRWVAGPGARYFASETLCAARLDELVDDAVTLGAMREASHARHAEAFTWERVLPAYEAVLEEARDAG
jgi:glycosyltransferase involved in cell wall biosynthesis